MNQAVFLNFPGSPGEFYISM